MLRTIGPVGDDRFEIASEACDGTNRNNFEFGVCSQLIACIYDHLDEAFKASLSTGTNIASLLPTILVLIGLPSGLFRQLRPLSLQHSQPNVLDLRIREWTVFLPSIGRSLWQHRVAKLAVDFAIVALLGVMLWRNLEVVSFTMVPWRCEYTYLLLAWPIACITWLLIAVLLLSCMKESIDIYNPANPSVKYGILGLMSLPYMVNPDRIIEEEPQALQYSSQREVEMENMASSDPEIFSSPYENSTSSYPFPARQHAGSTTSSQKPIITTIQRSDTISVPRGSNCVTIRITMPSSLGLRSWRWYEAAIETMAVGVYLYATFVLTSLLFLNADNAI
ncbi:MAG: hypothetical protein Q9171_007561, partial [Xanthocarpia ochracea]